MRPIVSILITVQPIKDSELHELCVKAGDDYDDFFATTGFDSVQECHEYARILAKGLGLDPEHSINADVSDYPQLTRIK